MTRLNLRPSKHASGREVHATFIEGAGRVPLVDLEVFSAPGDGFAEPGKVRIVLRLDELADLHGAVDKHLRTRAGEKSAGT